jgi:arsenite-transporting ATPase
LFFRGATHEIVKSNGGYEVVFNLPLAEKESVNLSKKGAELLVRVGGYKRNVLLPDSLARLEAAGAKIEGDKLKVRLQDGNA